MRICFINPTKMRRNEAYGLAKQLPPDHNVTILHPSESGKGVEHLDGSPNVTVRYFAARFLGNINYTIPWIPDGVAILAMTEGFDVIHAIDYFYPTCLPPLISKRRETKFILTCNAIPGYDWYSGNKWVDGVAKTYNYLIGKSAIKRYDYVIAL